MDALQQFEAAGAAADRPWPRRGTVNRKCPNYRWRQLAARTERPTKSRAREIDHVRSAGRDARSRRRGSRRDAPPLRGTAPTPVAPFRCNILTPGRPAGNPSLPRHRRHADAPGRFKASGEKPRSDIHKNSPPCALRSQGDLSASPIRRAHCGAATILFLVAADVGPRCFPRFCSSTGARPARAPLNRDAPLQRGARERLR